MVRNISEEYRKISYSSVEELDPKLVRQLNYVSNKTSHVVDFWLNNILVGYIMEFSIDCTQSYSIAERDFFKGTHRRFMKSLGT
jgi:hypothetical protein